MFLSRLSVCLFFRRLSASTRQTSLPNILTCVCAALGIISVFVVGLRQEVAEPWRQNPTTVRKSRLERYPRLDADTRSQLHRWITIEAFGILIDLTIAAYPVRLVWGLQMQASMKFWVLLGFGIRLP